jgi:hypothetical protein
MTAKEDDFCKEMTDKFKEFTHELDKRFTRIISTLVVFVICVLAFLFTHITKDAETRADVVTLKHNESVILKNAVTQKALSDILETFDNNTKAMEKFLPNDVQGFIEATNETNRRFRTYIMQFQSEINVRGVEISENKKGGNE